MVCANIAFFDLAARENENLEKSPQKRSDASERLPFKRHPSKEVIPRLPLRPSFSKCGSKTPVRIRPSSSDILTMPAKLSINDVDVAGKRVFMRVDFNVPQDWT